MKPQTIIKKYKQSRFGTTLQRLIAQENEIRIRQTKASFPLWEISAKTTYDVKIVYDDLVLFAHRYRYIVECPSDYFVITVRGEWYTQLVKISHQLTENE